MKRIFLILLLSVNFCFGQKFSGLNSTPQYSQFTINDICIASNPADNATNYIGAFPSGLMGGSLSGATTVNVNSTITDVSINFLAANGASTTSETTTIAVVVGGTTTTTLTTSFTYTTVNLNSQNITGLSISVPAGSSLITKCVFPAWATNPTGIVGTITYFLRPN